MAATKVPPLTTAEASEYARRHVVTIRRALESRELHGEQRVPGGPWSIREECVDAYLAGAICEHKQNVVPITPGP